MAKTTNSAEYQPTGLAWLDEFLGGGLIRNEVNLFHWASPMPELQRLILGSLEKQNFLLLSSLEGLSGQLDRPLLLHPARARDADILHRLLQINPHPTFAVFYDPYYSHPGISDLLISSPPKLFTCQSSLTLRLEEDYVTVTKDRKSSSQGTKMYVTQSVFEPPAVVTVWDHILGDDL